MSTLPLICHGPGGLLATAVLLAGCASSPQPTLTESYDGRVERGTEARYPDVLLVPVSRQGRYTLVELVPEPAQRDLMQQVVEVTIPPAFDTRVGDAMRHVLRRSGYRLCEDPEAAMLYALPLPAAHLRLGPLVLRDALLTLAGPAWDMAVDDTSRQVCFKPQIASVTASPATAPERAESTEHTDLQEGQP